MIQSRILSGKNFKIALFSFSAEEIPPAPGIAPFHLKTRSETICFNDVHRISDKSSLFQINLLQSPWS